MFRALRHKNFRDFYSGQAISQLGTWVQITALSWLVWRMTHSTATVGIVQFIGRIPALFVSPLAGVLADRYSRHRLVIIAQSLAMVQALMLAALTLSGHADVWSIAALACFLGFITSLDIPARQSFVFELAGRDDLPNAIALNSFMFNFARIIGPAVAGFMMARTSEGICFLLNGLSYTVVIYLLLRMKIAPRTIEPRKSSFARELLEAFHYVRTHRAIRNVLLYMGLVAAFGYTHAVILPEVADDVLGRGQKAYAKLLAASGGGAMFGAFYLARRVSTAGYGRVIPTAGLILGLGLIVFSFSRNYPLSLALLLPAGAGMMVQSAASNTLIQRLVPDRLRGRVMSFFSMVFLGMIPVGSLIMGAMAERLGPLVAIRIGGLICLVGGALLLMRLPSAEALREELKD